MFTGLVEEIGRVETVHATGTYQQVTVTAATVLEGTKVGDSIAVDGVCQTVTSMNGRRFSVETLAESLKKTTLGNYRPGRRVNLERALTPQSRLGGHFVQGHVDATATVSAVIREDKNVYFTVRLPAHLLPYCIPEGSIAIDGVSLTIASIRDADITVNIIPTTWTDTVLADRKKGDSVNIEVDLLARYVGQMLRYWGGPPQGSRQSDGPSAESHHGAPPSPGPSAEPHHGAPPSTGTSAGPHPDVLQSPGPASSTYQRKTLTEEALREMGY